MGILNYRKTGEINTASGGEIELLKGGSSWVGALPQRPTPLAYPVVGDIAPHSDGRALEAQPTVIETATPFWRAVALVIRSIAPALIITGLILLAALIVGADEWTAAAILVLGSVLVALFWYFTDKAERRDSAAGIEHHKIDEAAALAELREMNQHRLKRALVKDYIGGLNRASDND